VLDGIRVVKTSYFKNFLKMVLIRAFNFLPDTGCSSLWRYDAGGASGLFSALSALFGACGGDAGGALWPPPAVATTSTRAKAAPMASSPRVCQVAISNNSLMVSGCL
jgi:hypothetical protein